MLTDYERYQLEWMIEHGHSLDELMEELTNYQNDLESVPGVNLTVSDVFDSWTSNRGFEALENDTITKDMVRAGIEHGVIRFEANPDLSGHEGLESGIQSLDIKKTDNVREWYMLAFPTDGLGAEINPQLTFDDALSAVPTGNGFYSALGTTPDSVVRERVFEELCNRYGYTYDDIYGSWFDKTPLPGLESRSPQPEKIAIAAGYRFNLVDAREAAGIDLKGCGTVVTVDGHDYDVMKGATYEDSRKVDDLLDSHGDKPISGYRKQPQGMSLKQAAMESREASAKLAEKNGGTDDHDGKDER